MSNRDTTVTNQPGALAEAQQISEETRAILNAATSDATRRAYRDDIEMFTEYCSMRGLPALPATPQTVADYVVFIARNGNAWMQNPPKAPRYREAFKYATIERKVAAVSTMHEAADMDSPTRNKLVSATMSGLRNTLTTRQVKKQPITVERLYKLLAMVDDTTLQGKRDKALLMLAFAGAFRRSELAALDVEDMEFTEQGLKILVRKSKTDQSGAGQAVNILSKRLDTVGALRAYMQAAGIMGGALFRPVTKGDTIRNQRITDKSIAGIIKRFAAAAGFDPDQFGGHSTRRGFVTTALQDKADIFAVMRVTRHKGTQTLKEYADDVTGFDNHAGASFL